MFFCDSLVDPNSKNLIKGKFNNYHRLTISASFFSSIYSIPRILTFSCIEFLYAYQLLSSLPGISDTKKGGREGGGSDVN